MAYHAWTDKQVNNIKEDGHLNGSNEMENSYAILESSITKDDNSTEYIQPTENVAYQASKAAKVSMRGGHVDNKGIDNGYAILELPTTKNNNSTRGHSKRYSNSDTDDDYI